MNEIWNKIIEDKSPAVLFENFHNVEVTWADVMNFIYKEATTKSNFKPNPYETVSHTAEVINNLKVQRGVYLLPQSRDLHRVFKGVSELMSKITGSDAVNDCPYYVGSYNEHVCTCGSMWHIQGLRFSATEILINHHKDPCDVLYWQMLGNSYWTINKDKEYKLTPGDMLFISKDATHGIRQEGPRVAILIDGIKPGYGKDT